MNETAILSSYSKYRIYNDGRIEALSAKKCFLSQAKSKDGYYQINAIYSLARNGYRHTVKVHRLVAMAFVPNPNNYTEVNHIDGNKLNNHFTNLEWCTRSHNIKQCYELGLRNSDGSRNTSAKLNEWQVKAIRFLYRYYNYTQHKLGFIYGVTQTQIGYVLNGKSWKHI